MKCQYKGCTKQADYELQKGDKPSDTTYACAEHVEEMSDGKAWQKKY